VTASEKKLSLNICVLTVSDSRTAKDDSSGDLLCEFIQAAGHRLTERMIVKDDIYKIRAQVSLWVAQSDVQVILLTGGTGFSGRDSTPEAVSILFDKDIEGVGE